MSKQTLRQLAKNYAKGSIDKDDYRKSRSELIKNIIAGQVSVKAINYEEPLRPGNESDEAITEGIVRDRTEIIPPKQASANKPDNTPEPAKQNAGNNNKKSSLIFIIISIIIVLSLVLVVVLFYPKPPESSIVTKPDNSNSNNETSNSNVVATATDKTVAAEALIGAFLSEKNWTDENMDKFLDSWSALTDEERNYATGTKRMQRLKASIYKQFLEGKALASIDSEKSKMELEKLIKFANAIGIEDSRLIMD